MMTHRARAGVPSSRHSLIFALLMALSVAALSDSCLRPRTLPSVGTVERGIASWYGDDFHGRPTSNREIYNMYDMTAAHPTLPFGTHIMVTNLDNGRSAVVRINDRGPFVKNRIIDLSYAAARMLDMIVPGTAMVQVDILPHLSPPASVQKFSVQVGAFISRDNAETLAQRLRPRYPSVYIARFETRNQAYYRVRIRAESMDQARRLAGELARDGVAVLVLEEE